MNYIQNSMIGFTAGFILYLIELESPDVGNVVFRTDSSGSKSFSPESIFNMMKGPFKFSKFWTNFNLIKINWVITTGIGSILGLIYTFLINSYLY
jgi:hypothetical protein